MNNHTSFKHITIIGVGLLGGSLGISFIRKGYHVTGISRKETIQKALRLGVINHGLPYEKMEEGLRDSDLVVLSTPISRIVELLGEIGPYLEKGTIVTDVGSTKREISRAAEKCLPKGIVFIGGHPMAGSEKSGVEASDHFLFQNVIYVLTPGVNADADSLNRMRALIESIGARVVILSAKEHDAIAGAVSHLPQIIAVTLVNMVGTLDRENPFYLRMAAGGFRDLTRIAMSPFSMWKDILKTNKDIILTMIEMFMEKLEQVKSSLGSEELGEDFMRAAQTRTGIPRDTKGFMSELHDIWVVAEDRPGEIATIANLLSRENINIKDIEVLKVREGEGGTLRLAFENERDAARSVTILTVNGYTARIRR